MACFHRDGPKYNAKQKYLGCKIEALLQTSSYVTKVLILAEAKKSTIIVALNYFNDIQ